MAKQCNVGSYLVDRLAQLGIKHLFSVPGDYSSDFLEIVDNHDSVKRIGNCNELNAGYAADGYSRIRGLGAVSVTTGVGSFSLLNAIGGAYVEDVPVIAIIGTLSNTKLLNEINGAELYHHNVGIDDTNRTVYSPITVAYERISNPMTAPTQIDNALIACISKKKPIAIEIMEDVYYMYCDAPKGDLKPVENYEPMDGLRKLASENPPNKYAKEIITALDNAASSFYEIISESKYPLLWIGKEIATYGLQDKFLELQKLIQAPFANTLLSKAIISENDPWHIGLMDGKFISEQTQKFVDQSDCILGLGVWNTDLNEFGTALADAGNIATLDASRNMVKVGPTPDMKSSNATNTNINPSQQLYVSVSLSLLLDEVIEKVKNSNYKSHWKKPDLNSEKTEYQGKDNITYDSFFSNLDKFINADDIVVADIGLSTFGGSSSLKIERPGGFQAQNIWASIGWSVPAGLGASFSEKGRTVVVVGDGAFKLTCQAISTMVMEKRNTVVFVLNNKVYGVEQMLLDPGPYKSGSKEPFEEANVLQEWDYTKLIEAFSNNNPNAKGLKVKTNDDFIKVLKTIEKDKNSVFLVNIDLDERDYPSAWSPFVK